MVLKTMFLFALTVRKSEPTLLQESINCQKNDEQMKPMMEEMCSLNDTKI